MIFLLGLPASLMWLVLTTVNHARAKEDELRRIDEIERLANQIAGMELLTFQSRHPNRNRTVGGRTGIGTVCAVWTVCLTLLAGCVYLSESMGLADSVMSNAYAAYVGCATLYVTLCVLRLRYYRYRKPPFEAGPVIVSERTKL